MPSPIAPPVTSAIAGALVVAVLGLAGCADSGDGATATTSSTESATSDPASAPAVTAPSAGTTSSTGSSSSSTSAATSTSAAGSTSPTGSSSSPASTSSTTTSASSSANSSSTAAPPAKATCSATGKTFAPPATGGMSPAAAALAQRLYAAATTCDRAALVSLAKAGGTRLSFGEVGAEQALVVPDREQRYAALARVLAAPSGRDQGAWVQPRVATPAGTKDATAWQEAVSAGLLSQEQAKDAQEFGEGYMGWRSGISEGGTWQFFLAGD
ncbi:MAG: hypothetical protein LWW86_08550 [Micrococcales bacterium]|nr:hypothetical protein [Micrococcales bacterium]